MHPTPTRRVRLYKLAVCCAVAALALGWYLRGPQTPRAQAQGQLPPPYKNFEGPLVHPLTLTPDGTRLLVLNTRDARLAVFQLGADGLTLAREIPVGLEPVSVVARNDTEAWVANWLSDSVSVVNLTTGNVVRTLDVGDEPTDIVFAGPQRAQAFVCVSGLNQVQVYNADAPESAPQVVPLRGKQPRALTRDAAGTQVFVSIFESGNQTTIVPPASVAAGGGPPPPVPALGQNLPPAPAVGLIVKWDGTRWADETGDARWHNFLPYTLADVDVVALDTRAATPVVAAEVRHVGTNIGNAVFDSSARRLYVVNLEARNVVRFEPNLRGKFMEQRLSLIDFQPAAPRTTTLNLNPHINLNRERTPADDKSLALPADITRAADGTLYVAAMGSNKVGVLSAAGAVQARVDVGPLPTGLALDEARARLYVLNRGDQTISVVDTQARRELARLPIGPDPEPAQARAGRSLFYSGAHSGHLDLACASCHLDGHRDGLAWDLGDPQGQMQLVNNAGLTFNFHPMKGPMTTQSLRGISSTNPAQTTEPLHWRGDRATLADFNPAFASLLGGAQLNATELAAFTAFVRALTYPPNPNQNLDRTLPNPATGPSALRGQLAFNSQLFDRGVVTCASCHRPANNLGTNRTIIPAVLLQESQDFKVPQLRGLYQKTGLARAAGEQLTGYGFAHDGNFATLFDFLRSPVFTMNDGQRRDMEAFMLAFDTGTAPAVGLQATVNATNKSAPATLARIALLVSQADAGNCDLIVKGLSGGAARGYLYVGNNQFRTDRTGEPLVPTLTLVQSADAGAELTFTGVPPGEGTRRGINRFGGLAFDGDTQPVSFIHLNGRVTRLDNTPVSGVQITVSGAAPAQFATTDANGFYDVPSVRTGPLVVSAAKTGLQFAPPGQSLGNVFSPDPFVVNFVVASSVQFSAANFSANERDLRATLTVTRTGDTATTAAVNYATVDDPAAVGCADTVNNHGAAYARCDYATTADTLTFAPGETQRQIVVPLIPDAHGEGVETVTLRLSDPTGATLGPQPTTTLSIVDDNSVNANPVFATPFFVRQQYLDFLSREPEAGEPWTGVLNNCADPNNTDPNSPSANCDRLTVSAAFFGSPEFRLKGFYVFLFYKVAYGRTALPTYDEIVADMRAVTGATQPETFAKRAAFATDFLARPAAIVRYPNTLTDAQYVAALLAPYGVHAITTPDPQQPDGDTLVTLSEPMLGNQLTSGTLTRAQVLRAVVQSNEVGASEFNGAFVAMQYYGYLRRTPEAAGYQAWLDYLSTHPQDFRTMVNGFMNSQEYRLRFGAN